MLNIKILIYHKFYYTLEYFWSTGLSKMHLKKQFLKWVRTDFSSRENRKISFMQLRTSWYQPKGNSNSGNQKDTKPCRGCMWAFCSCVLLCLSSVTVCGIRGLPQMFRPCLLCCLRKAFIAKCANQGGWPMGFWAPSASASHFTLGALKTCTIVPAFCELWGSRLLLSSLMCDNGFAHWAMSSAVRLLLCKIIVINNYIYILNYWVDRMSWYSYKFFHFLDQISLDTGTQERCHLGITVSSSSVLEPFL